MLKTAASLLLVLALLVAIGAPTHTQAAVNRIFLTSGTSWTVPSDWDSSHNTIEVIGGGSGGGNGGNGGGGGGYSRVQNVTLTPSGSVTYAVGSGGTTGNAGGDTYLCNSTSNCASISGTAVVVGAKGGTVGTGGGGGPVFVASTTYSGGNGGTYGSDAGAGGGGAAGPRGAGVNGSTYVLTTGGAGGAGGGGYGGSGGQGEAVAGSAGNEWDATHGSGGGGGGSHHDSTAAAGGLYGGGGGSKGSDASGSGASGAAGIIVITYVTSGSFGLTLTGNVKFAQNLAVLGGLYKGSGTFVIDDPADPARKLLYHSFVESPDVKNIYDGIATLDESGEATIKLPAYFEALNKDFRYQFFPLDEAMPNLYIKDEVKDNQFTIAGGAPGGRVSWQVTGVRHDAYILANPVRVEVEKGPNALVNKGECIFEPLCE